MAPGAAALAAMKAGMRSAGCWPSLSITSAWVKPCSAACCNAASTAAPLPRLAASRSTLNAPPSGGSSASEPSVLPSTTTQTGAQAARASATVRLSSGPEL